MYKAHTMELYILGVLVELNYVQHLLTLTSVVKTYHESKCNNTYY